MNAIALRLRQLTLAILLVAATIPVLASGAAAAPSCFSVQFSGVLPGFGTSASITTQECGSIPGSTVGTFIVRVGGYPIAEGELTAQHTLTSVTATFEGELTAAVPGLIKGQEFNGSLMFNAGTGGAGLGSTTVHFDDIGTVTVNFACTPNAVGYSCAPGIPVFVPERD
jgi:hypothetical protein